jgi:hypothetical protein
MANSFGDRNVVTKVTGAFIKTLIFFGVADGQGIPVVLKHKLAVNEEQTRVIFQLFAHEIIKAPQISLGDLPAAVFGYFRFPPLKELAQKYNGLHWDYHHGMKDDLIVVYKGNMGLKGERQAEAGSYGPFVTKT